MAATPAWTAWSLALLTLASGCTTSPQTEPASPPPGLAVPPAAPLPEAAPPAPVTEDSCGVEGLVMDDDLTPLAGVDVRIPGSAPRRTALDGRFSFGYLEPDVVHEVSVNADAWEPQTRDVMCRAGERITDVYFILHRPLWWGEPFVAQYLFRGRFGCDGPFPRDPCGEWPLDDFGLPDPTPLDPEAKFQFEFHMEPGRITGAVYEVKWSHASGVTGGFEELYLHSPLYVTAIVAWSLCPTTQRVTEDSPSLALDIVGSSVMCARFEAKNHTKALATIDPPPSNPSPTSGDPTLRNFVVTRKGLSLSEAQDPAAVERQTRLAVGQSFEVFMAFFYYGAPIPDDYAYFER